VRRARSLKNALKLGLDVFQMIGRLAKERRRPDLLDWTSPGFVDT
jgi:hypothetical protein